MDAYHADAEPHVYNNEPTCLAYYFCVPPEYSNDIPSTQFILAFESYTKRSDLYDIHMHSEALQTFLPKIGKTMITGLDLTHFEDVGGFIDKPGKCKPAAVVKVTRVKAYPGKRDEVLEMLRGIAEAAEKEEKDTYTFFILKSLDNDVDVRVLERYGSEEGLKAHMRGEKYLEGFAGAKDIVASLEGHRYVETGEGWLHR